MIDKEGWWPEGRRGNHARCWILVFEYFYYLNCFWIIRKQKTSNEKIEKMTKTNSEMIPRADAACCRRLQQRQQGALLQDEPLYHGAEKRSGFTTSCFECERQTKPIEINEKYFKTKAKITTRTFSSATCCSTRCQRNIHSKRHIKKMTRRLN